jgi:hypothetical protein
MGGKARKKKHPVVSNVRNSATITSTKLSDIAKSKNVLVTNRGGIIR